MARIDWNHMRSAEHGRFQIQREHVRGESPFYWLILREQQDRVIARLLNLQLGGYGAAGLASCKRDAEAILTESEK